VDWAGATTTVTAQAAVTHTEAFPVVVKDTLVPGGAVVPVAATQTSPGTTNLLLHQPTVVEAGPVCRMLVEVDV
tara:strand:- start:422 stop:643 length:222 start_codon:yes stop_codon:yes gene_type:complete